MADINALYASLLAADEARDARGPGGGGVADVLPAGRDGRRSGRAAAPVPGVCGRAARQRQAADPTRSPDRCLRGGILPVASLGPDLPCTDDPELFFAESPDDVETAKALCRECPARVACLAGALERREPWGVWGGELFLRGAIVPRKRRRGRPTRGTWLPSSQREIGVRGNEQPPGASRSLPAGPPGASPPPWTPGTPSGRARGTASGARLAPALGTLAAGRRSPSPAETAERTSHAVHRNR